MNDAAPLPAQQPAPAALGPLPAASVPGLYIHVPFCFHKCHYCDFYSIAPQSAQRMDRYVELALAEADRWAGQRQGPSVLPATVFLGGGTPTLLPLPAMRRLLAGLRQRFDLSAVNEWTVEANPATVSLEYCQMLREQGVDRLSFGAQSFDPAELAVLERRHRPEDVFQSVQVARAAGFTRLNLDLIYAIPGQDLQSWSRSLDQALAVGTEHLSCYNLTYEPNTPMAVRRRMGDVAAVEEDQELAMLHEARRRLAAAGLAAYEISNHARPGAECRHNLLYWSAGNYLGLGPSAASHVEGWRWRNRPHLGEWEQAIQRGDLPLADVERLGPMQRGGELVMLGLRLARGVRFDDYHRVAGADARATYGTLLQQLQAAGLLHIEQDGFGLTESGVNVADAVAAEFLSAAPPAKNAEMSAPSA